LLRDLAQSRQARKKTTRKTGESIAEDNRWPAKVSNTLEARYFKDGGIDNQHVNANCPKFVPIDTVSAFAVRTANTNANGHGISENKTHTLDGANGQAISFSAHMSEPMVHKDKSGTLQAKNPTAFVYENHAQDARVKDMGDTCQTVTATWGAGGNNQPLVQQSVIRRLTPVECERLQGFPDNYTQIPWKGKAKEDCPDSHRYKALGNAMAVPVIQFLGKNIVDYERKRNEER